MRLTIAIIALIALAILAFSAAMFDTTTVLVIGVAMVIVGFFSGAAVALGVITRRAEQRTHGRADIDHAEVIRSSNADQQGD